MEDLLKTSIASSFLTFLASLCYKFKDFIPSNHFEAKCVPWEAHTIVEKLQEKDPQEISIEHLCSFSFFLENIFIHRIPNAYKHKQIAIISVKIQIAL